MNRITFGVLLIILILTFALAVPAAASPPPPDRFVTPSMAAVAQANLPDPEETGNMTMTYKAVAAAWERAGKDTSGLTYIGIEVGGEVWLTVDPPRPYYGGGDSD